MQIVKVGITYQQAPISVREKVTFSEDVANRAMKHLNAYEAIHENVIFSTCNRTEIYAVTESAEIGVQRIKQFMMGNFQIDQYEWEQYFTCTFDHIAIGHLFKLTAGIDSMVIGETQILGQVKEALAKAQAINATRKMLNELFKRAITFAKRAHQDTGIGKQAVSISYVAVELIKQIFRNIEDKHVVIVGAGETGEISMKNLQGAGVSEMTVINRTFRRAQTLAEKFHADTATYEQLTDMLVEADIAITATASSNIILTGNMLEAVMEKRNGRSLCLIDIAVPRDVDPKGKDLENLLLYDVDDLQDIANKNIDSRRKAAIMVEQQITKEIEAFDGWIAMQDAVPIIKALQEKSYAIQEQTWQSIERKIPDLTEHEMEVLQKHMKSIANQLLQEPIQKAKMMANSKERLALLQDIFGLENVREKSDQDNGRDVEQCMNL